GDAVDVFSVRPLLVNKVAVEGAVDQPSDYELTPGMRVSDLLQRARGLLPEAYLGRADLYRWNPDNTNRLISIDLEKALAHDPDADVVLTRWDRLKVYTRKEVAWTGRRTVTVRGAVQRAGVYDYSQNMRVRDLLLMAGGPTPDAYMPRAVLLHQNGNGTFDYEYINIDEALKGNREADAAIRDNDVLALYRVNEAHFEPDHFVTIRGEVVAPGIYPRGEGMRASDLLTLAGGFRPGGGSRVVVAHARRAADDPKTTLITANVAFDAQGKCAPQDDVLLEDGDVVTVQGTGGFQEKVALVTIKGAVERPGPIVLTNKEMRLSDALKVVGGLRPEAFPEGTEFRRDPRMLASAGQKDLALIIGKLNDLLNESERKRLLAKTHVERIKAVGAASQGDNLPVGLGGATSAPVPVSGALVNSLAQDELVSRPRTLGAQELEPNGNIAVNLNEALRHPGGNEDILLMDGDVITVPETPTTVQVVGAVVNGRGVLFKPGAGLDYYVEQAGGYTVDAAKDRIVVIHAGGGLIPARKIRDLRPGDVIVVPTRVLAEKLASNGNGLDRFFRAITNTAITTLLAVRLFGL
ncbi:MAG TPA: SLBB domain-containing protein, partial [Chthonomonadaceae bacterium]|nr:SLBB domain-containing protein [Chthonomonadaceae bacterium]